MAVLLDTGILLRLLNADDPLHQQVSQAVEVLMLRREQLCITTQNLAELWNVATRPVANNGLNLLPSVVSQTVQEAIESFCTIVTEPEAMPTEFRRLLLQYSVVGKKVHDARLVAIMLALQIGSVLTLNEHDFRRYEPEGINILTTVNVVPQNP